MARQPILAHGVELGFDELTPHRVVIEPEILGTGGIDQDQATVGRIVPYTPGRDNQQRHRNEGNAASTTQGVRNLELWLGNYQEKGFHWDVIQFNPGLHDLKQVYDAKTEVFGAYSVPIEDYQKNLEKEIAILKKTGAKLIWCSTTPVPNHNKGQYARRKGAEKEFNEAAREVMKRHPEILINDLAQVVNESPVFDKWRETKDVHFYQKEEQKALGEAVAKAVRATLDTSTSKVNEMLTLPIRLVGGGSE